MKNNEIFVGGWYYIGDNPYGHVGELAYVIECTLNGDEVIMHNSASFKCRKCDLLPIKIKSEYLLENGWELITEDPDDGSKCYGIDIDKYFIDWWEPTDKVSDGILGLGQEDMDIPLEIPLNTLHKLQMMLMFWGYPYLMTISDFLPESNGNKTKNKKKKNKHK